MCDVSEATGPSLADSSGISPLSVRSGVSVTICREVDPSEDPSAATRLSRPGIAVIFHARSSSCRSSSSTAVTRPNRIVWPCFAPLCAATRTPLMKVPLREPRSCMIRRIRKIHLDCLRSPGQGLCPQRIPAFLMRRQQRLQSSSQRLILSTNGLEESRSLCCRLFRCQRK